MPLTHSDIMPSPFISILVGAAVTRAALLAASTKRAVSRLPHLHSGRGGGYSREHTRIPPWGLGSYSAASTHPAPLHPG